MNLLIILLVSLVVRAASFAVNNLPSLNRGSVEKAANVAEPHERKIARWIIQWRGEGAEGYSMSLRQWEFTSAFRAELTSYILNHDIQPTLNLKDYLENVHFEFMNALEYRGPVYDPKDPSSTEHDINHMVSDIEPIPLSQVEAYESAMQYVIISDDNNAFNAIGSIANRPSLMTNLIKSTVERCSLVRTAIDIVAGGNSYEELANQALSNGALNEMMENGESENSTWSIRLRRYGLGEKCGQNEEVKESTSTNFNKNPQYQARYGKNVRSPLKDEKNAMLEMSDLVKRIKGRVNLKNPDCKIYLLEGLRDCFSVSEEEKSKILLGRVIANGPKTSIYAPKTRICITTTPLCPIASFALCNIAQTLRDTNTTILDPFAGSCATLLAAAHITNGQCNSVGIEICHNGYVNRDNIQADFETRSLPPPLVIRGDCLASDVRDKARFAIGGTAFDTIITDPPYGIREAMGSSQDTGVDTTPPLTKLFHVMRDDRSIGKPLLKKGGRLVAFVPVRKGETLVECLPPFDVQKEAGLVLEGEGKEQVLNDVLSRWLVSFVCA